MIVNYIWMNPSPGSSQIFWSPFVNFRINLVIGILGLSRNSFLWPSHIFSSVRIGSSDDRQLHLQTHTT